MDTQLDELARVNTLPELVASLRALLARKGMSYSALAKAAEALPRRGGQLSTLPKSTVSDMLAGRRVPPKDKFVTLLSACDVPAEEMTQWLAARERVSTSPAPPPEPQSRIRPRSWRRTVLIAAAAALVSAAGTAAVFLATRAQAPDAARPLPTGAKTPPPKGSAREPVPLIVTDKNWTHWTPDARDASHAWEVAPGGRYFYCWTIGDPITRHNDVSDRWVLTVDDHGNKDVYISVLWLRDADTGALPRC